MDMVRSLMSISNLNKFLWKKVLKTTIYILNRVPNKSITKISFELWTNRKLNLNHLRVLGCPIEIRIYNPHEKKLDPKTIFGFFIGYLVTSKGYRFYFPKHGTHIVKSMDAKFFKDDCENCDYP